MARVLLYSRLMRRAELSLKASVSTDLGPRACRADDETQDSSLGCAIIDLVDGAEPACVGRDGRDRTADVAVRFGTSPQMSAQRLDEIERPLDSG